MPKSKKWQNFWQIAFFGALSLGGSCSFPILHKQLREPVFENVSDISEKSLEDKVNLKSYEHFYDGYSNEKELVLPHDVALVYSCLLEGAQIDPKGKASGDLLYTNLLEGSKGIVYNIQAHYSRDGEAWMSVLVGTPPENWQLCYFDGKNGAFDGFVDRAVQYELLESPGTWKLNDLPNPENFSSHYNAILKESLNVIKQILKQKRIEEQKTKDMAPISHSAMNLRY